MKLMDAPYASEFTTLDWQVETVETAEPQLTEAERQRWIWVYERLKSADLGIAFSEKAKFFCDASTPEEVEQFIEAHLEEPAIIPLAA